MLFAGAGESAHAFSGLAATHLPLGKGFASGFPRVIECTSAVPTPKVFYSSDLAHTQRGLFRAMLIALFD